MSVKKEPSGRRSIQVEVEVPGTPEEVWQAIATEQGITSWFVPAKFEEQDGQPVAVTLNFGPGMDSTSEVTIWNPPIQWATKSDGWVPGSPPIANEWSIEARSGGTCIVRIVQSLFASTDDWDNQLEGAESGWPAFLRTLRIVLTYFRGQRSAVMKCTSTIEGTESDAWESLTSAIGVKGVSVGQRWTSPPSVPSFGGDVEYFSQNPYDALLRIDQPAPGILSLGAYNCGGPIMVALNLTLFGDNAEQTLARETPAWQGWFQKKFPASS